MCSSAGSRPIAVFALASCLLATACAAPAASSVVIGRPQVRFDVTPASGDMIVHGADATQAATAVLARLVADPDRRPADLRPEDLKVPGKATISRVVPILDVSGARVRESGAYMVLLNGSASGSAAFVVFGEKGSWVYRPGIPMAAGDLADLLRAAGAGRAAVITGVVPPGGGYEIAWLVLGGRDEGTAIPDWDSCDRYAIDGRELKKLVPGPVADVCAPTVTATGQETLAP